MALACMALMLSLSGCSDDDDTVRPPAREDPRKTIAGVMQELIDAYEERDIDRYEALFDQEHFLFVFDPYDVNDPDTDIPPNWDWVEEQSANRNMFQSQIVERIELNFVLGTPEPATEQDAEDRPFPEGTMKVSVSEIHLLVDTRNPAGGENILYIADGDHAIFFLLPDQNEIDGVPVWRIFEWRDLTIPAPVIENSWGEIKYYFR
jgi:hypothetical protein